MHKKANIFLSFMSFSCCACSCEAALTKAGRASDARGRCARDSGWGGAYEGLVDLEGRYGKVFIVIFGHEWRVRVGNGRGLGDEGEAGGVLQTAEASMPTMVYGRRLRQLEVVLPRLGRSSRCPHFRAVVVAGAGVVVEGFGIARPFALAVMTVIAGPTARPPNLLGKYRRCERGRVEHTVLIKAFRHRRSVGHGFVAGARALPLELDIHPGFEVIEREILPSMLDLDIGQSEAVLQRAGHLPK